MAKQPLSSFDDVYKVKNAFLASGYQVDWEGEGKPFHLSKKIAENIYSFNLDFLEEGFYLTSPSFNN